MTDFKNRNKIKKFCIIILSSLLICIIFSGCLFSDFAVEKVADRKSKDKIACTINKENATQIVYKNTTYQILNKTLKKSEIGGWRGVFKKIAVLDEKYNVISQTKIKIDYETQIKDITNELPSNAKYVVPYYNAFAILGTDDEKAIAINIFNEFYKAVPVETNPKDKEVIKFDTKNLEESISLNKK